jgi:hypothetical protein
LRNLDALPKRDDVAILFLTVKGETASMAQVDDVRPPGPAAAGFSRASAPSRGVAPSNAAESTATGWPRDQDPTRQMIRADFGQI